MSRAALAVVAAPEASEAPDALWEADVWHADRLPRMTDRPPVATDRLIIFTGLEPAFLRQAAKRWARNRLLSGYAFGGVARYVRSLRAFSAWMDDAGIVLRRPQEVTRDLLERYRAAVGARPIAAATKCALLGDLKQVLDEVRAAGWLALPPTATYLRGELPRPGQERLPKAISGPVMSQIEAPENLARLRPLSVQTAVVLMIDCGLRIIDVLRLPPQPVEIGSDGHPYLRFYNHKAKREAVIPLARRAHEQIERQRAFLAERWPQGSAYLLPPVGRGASPDRHLCHTTVRRALTRWIAECDIREPGGELARVWPHRFRHTLGTRLINDGVEQRIVQALLDHSSPEMTAVYARLRDSTLRRQWEAWQERVNIRGERVLLDADGPLGEAAWTKERLARARQTLPNGYCGLPLQQSCPHPNACLTCPSFLTDETHRQAHEDQLRRTRELIGRAREAHQERVVAMNLEVQRNLERILAGLDALADARRDTA
jgi:integrase